MAIMGRAIEERRFMSKDREYVINALASETELSVRVFLNNRPGSRFTYSVFWETSMDVSTILEMSAVETLLELAEKDVREGIV
jgi:hypothetical protein